ncbi:MAG: acetate uptake transporter [Actinomycetota bacterium]|nr:acetate uptake transporter [Actinomycetota bacterium]
MTATIEPTIHPGTPAYPDGPPDARTAALVLPPADAVVPIADPAPLGLAAFAGTTFVLSLFNAGLGDARLVAVVLPLALLYGGLAQLLAGMWEFRNDNTFGAVAFTSYGAFWISYFVYARFVAGTLPPADAHTATGIFLLMWTIFTVYMTLAALKTNAALIAVFGTVLVTFALLTIGELSESTSVLHAGGYVGLVSAACAWYASAAGVVNPTWGRTVLPVFPVRKG